ncbi:hypothetical protein [Synechococcus sp. W55.2]|uniref:hypothetical protein n=1 Tax=Synechococcus sp. W55.2 TaxID=2964513 RepID=UPI0039C2EE8D
MNTPTVQNVFRHWRRWRTWAGLLLLAAAFFVIESHPRVWSQSSASSPKKLGLKPRPLGRLCAMLSAAAG